MPSVEYKTSTVLTSDDLRSLNETVDHSDQTSRYCYHKSENSSLHKMLICIPNNKHYPAHRHTDSDETIIVLKGQLIITFFNATGEFEEEVILNPASDSENTNISVLIEKDRWHSVKSGDCNTSFLEIKLGPFDKNKMEFLRQDEQP